MKEISKNLIQLHCAVLLFGLSGMFGKIIVMPVTVIVFGRVFFAGIAMFLLFMIRGTDMRLKTKSDFTALFAAGIVLSLHWLTFFRSVQLATVAIAVLTYSAYPVFVTFIEPLVFNEKAERSDILAAFVILGGVLLIVPSFKLDSNITVGVIFGVLSSFSYAALSVMNRKYVHSYSGTVVAFYEQSAAALILTPFAFSAASPVMFTPTNMLLLVLLGVVFTAASHSLFISGLRNVSARTAGVIASLESVYGIIAAMLILGETPSLREIAGGAIILGTAMWSTMKTDKRGSCNP